MAPPKDNSIKSKLDCVLEIVHKPLKEKGEDSFAYSFENDLVHTQAVFDGCGGSGSWQYAEYRNATGAFISAQSMGRAYLEWFRAMPAEMREDAEKTGSSFGGMASKVLSGLKNECAPMKVSGSLVKAFPCTASAAIMAGSGDYLALTTINVGDSRVYFLTPQTGLVQVTEDDSEGNPDPMESLRDSAPLSDMLNADKPFRVKTCRLNIAYPCAVLCASDGVFGYLRSPMDFEYLLLDTLMKSRSFSQMEETLTKEIVKVTGDDSTCIMSFYGWGSFENTQRLMARRHGELAGIVRTLDEAMDGDSFDQVLDGIWEEYKKRTLYYKMQG